MKRRLTRAKALSICYTPQAEAVNKLTNEHRMRDGVHICKGVEIVNISLEE